MEVRDAGVDDLPEILSIFNEAIANSTAVWFDSPDDLHGSLGPVFNHACDIESRKDHEQSQSADHDEFHTHRPRPDFAWDARLEH